MSGRAKCYACGAYWIDCLGHDDPEPEVCSNCGAYFDARLNPTKWQRCGKCMAGLRDSDAARSAETEGLGSLRTGKRGARKSNRPDTVLQYRGEM